LLAESNDEYWLHYWQIPEEFAIMQPIGIGGLVGWDAFEGADVGEEEGTCDDALEDAWVGAIVGATLAAWEGDGIGGGNGTVAI